MLVKTYGDCGFGVHSGKNEIMSDCDVFLRLTVENDHVVGYPARLLMSITYMKPEKDITITTKCDTIQTTRQLNLW